MAQKHMQQNHSTNSRRLHPLSGYFSKFAQAVALWTGHPAVFLLALTVVLTWILTGPVFGYSDSWQLVINTGTTIVTFLMVFLIQNTQNRDMVAVQIKLSELVLAMEGAENKFAAIEDLSDEELELLHAECRASAELARDRLERRRAGVRGNGRPRAAGHRAKARRRTAT